MPSKNTSVLKPYNSLDDASDYLTENTKNTFTTRDLLFEAKKGRIKLCFYYDGELGVFSDPYTYSEFEYTGKSFNFDGYLGLDLFDVTLNREMRAYRVDIIEALPKSDQIPPLEKVYYSYGEVSPPDGAGEQFHYPIDVKQEDIFISKSELENYIKLFSLPKSKTKPLSTNERNTLDKIILGIAIEKYGYDPEKKRNTATGNNKDSITSDLQKHGLNVSNDTIKKILERAKELL